MTMARTACRCTQCWTTWLQATLLHFVLVWSILILYLCFSPQTGLLRVLLFLCFPTRIFYELLPHLGFMSCQNYLLLLKTTLIISVNNTRFNLLKPTGHVMHQQFNIQQLYVLPTLYLCFVFTWEQTATSATYSINWLVFITEMKSVYCAVRNGSLNKAVCASYLKG